MVPTLPVERFAAWLEAHRIKLIVLSIIVAFGAGAFAALLGAGLGGCFALMMIVALEHLPDPAEAGALSALMQGGGFMIAALAPWIVAALHDETGSFVIGWILHLVCVAAVAGLIANLAPERYARAMSTPLEGPSFAS